MKDFIPSPCNRKCTLNEADICIGCYRSRLEILEWLKMDADQQRATLERCVERKKQAPDLRQRLKKLFER